MTTATGRASSTWWTGLPARVGVMCLAAVALYAAAWRQAPLLDGDSAQYMEVARDLADGRLDTLHFRTPGYPWLLVVTGSAYTPTHRLLVVSLALHAACVWLIALLMSRAGAGARWVIGLTVILLLPPYVEPAAYVMTENLAQVTLVAGLVPLVLWFTGRRRSLLVAASVAVAAAALVRPAYQLLAPALCVALLVLPAASRAVGPLRGAARRAALAVLAGWIAIVGGAALLNGIRFGVFGLSPSTGFHLSTKTMGLVERLPDEYAEVREILIRERDAQLVKRGGTHTPTQTIWGARAELERATGRTGAQLSAYLVRMNLELIRRAPVEYLQEVARSAAVYWFPAAGRLAAMGSDALRWLWTLLHGVVVIGFAVEVVVLAGVWVFVATLPRIAGKAVPAFDLPAVAVLAYGLSATMVFYTMALSCLVDIGEPRQRRPTDVLIVFMCLLGAFVWRRLAAGAAASPGQSRARD